MPEIYLKFKRKTEMIYINAKFIYILKNKQKVSGLRAIFSVNLKKINTVEITKVYNKTNRCE